MLRGISYALGACSVWGLLFVIPQFLPEFTSIEIALGTYWFYGIISLGILLCNLNRFNKFLTLPILWNASKFSLISTILYYTAVVLALRFATPAICALTLGTSPILIGFYGNWKKKECRFRSLIIPALFIVCGLFSINLPKLTAGQFSSTYFVGLFCGFIGLLCWGWYAVENSRFLKENPSIQSDDWSTLVGVATLFWVIIGTTILTLFFQEELELQKYMAFDSTLRDFCVGCAILGILCTWVAASLWNRASVTLPVSLLGQLAVFETIFGLTYFYTVEQHLPQISEGIGIVCFLSAVAVGIYTQTQTTRLQVTDTSSPLPELSNN